LGGWIRFAGHSIERRHAFILESAAIRLGRPKPKLLRVKSADQCSHQVTDRITPIVLPRSADEITRRIVHLSLHFALLPRAMHRDDQCELSQSATDA
jgi:hypothetical protein